MHFDLEATKMAVPETYEIHDVNTPIIDGYLHKLCIKSLS